MRCEIMKGLIYTYSISVPNLLLFNFKTAHNTMKIVIFDWVSDRIKGIV